METPQKSSSLNTSQSTSPLPIQQRLAALRRILPEVFAEDKVDWEKLKATLGEHVHMNNERYTLNWAGKSEAFRAIQTPSTRTLMPDKASSLHFDDTKNIFIEGENLEVLKVLQKSYSETVKMIYIDPPYNTGKDLFIYPDTFAEHKAAYQRRIGDKDEAGYMTQDGMFRKNSKENGQYHSNWLSMMYPRLFLARTLMRDDGVIFVSIDDNEVHNLRLLMDEIFGEENFVGIFKWNKTATPPSLSKKIRHKYEFVLCYEKLLSTQEYNGGSTQGGDMPLLNEGNTIGTITIPKEHIMFNFDGIYPPKTYDRVRLLHPLTITQGRANCDLTLKGPFKWTQRTVDSEIQNNTRFIIKSQKFAVRYIRDGIRQKKPADIISKTECNVGTNEDASKEIASLFGSNLMSFPKPSSLIRYLCNFTTRDDDIILDFFAGSGTTAHAVMALNAEDGGKRRCISVQLPEPCDEKTEAYKAGYRTIADMAKERIRRAASLLSPTKATQGSTPDLGFKAFKLSDSNLKQWQSQLDNNPEALQRQLEEHIDPITKTATPENMMYELLLKNGKDINSVVEYKHQCYYINDTELVFMLETITQGIITTIIQQRPKKVIALDRLFERCDHLKTNTVLQMQDAGIEFKTM